MNISTVYTQLIVVGELYELPQTLASYLLLCRDNVNQLIFSLFDHKPY